MRMRRPLLLAIVLAGTALLAQAGAARAAAPAWHLNLFPLPADFAPGSAGSGEGAPMYRVVATNIGGANAVGPIGFKVKLPVGLTPVEDAESPTGDSSQLAATDPACSVTGQTVTCVSAGPIQPGRWIGAMIPISVDGGLQVGEILPDAQASIESSGATTVGTSSEVRIGTEVPPFGFLSGDDGLDTLFTNSDGSAAIKAGARPAQLTIGLAFPTEHMEGFPLRSAGHVRDVVTDLPQGLAIDPNATPVRCTEVQLTSNECPLASQLGTITAMTEITGPTPVISGLFNMVPPAGTPAAVAFNAFNVNIFVHLSGEVRSESDYGISTASHDILALTNNPVLSVEAQLWGDPSAASHDGLRGDECRASFGALSCPVEPRETPLLTMPSACSGPLATEAHARSWEESDEGIEELAHHAQAQSTDVQGNPVGVNGCSLLEFEPTLSLQPDTNAAEGPAGVHVHLHVPQNPGKGELATSNVKDTTVTLPAGMALNPAAADGLQACSPAQIGMKTEVGESPAHFTDQSPQCPDGSKVGAVTVKTPLLDHPLPGALYVAQPYENPFGTLLAAYVVIDDPADGIVAKLAGRTEADPLTGQLTVSFSEAPELPFEDFEVDLFGGPRAVLRTPSTCGTFTTASVEVPWSGAPPVKTEDSFAVSRGANGGPCASSEAQLPDSPGFEAGTRTPLAGAYSPFGARLQRADGTQQLKDLAMSLPAGLTGKLAGVESCPDSALTAAATRPGVQELADPSCPAASQIGTVKVGAGAGPTPFYTTARIYLTGPYQGGPISAAVIAPAVAGPFDLGTVVIRAATHIDPATAVLSVRSEDAPHILAGIPLELRDVRIDLDRPTFTLNPTNCDEKQLAGTATSLLGHQTPLTERFQVGGCRGLDYKPNLTIRLRGGTARGAHPRLHAVLFAKQGEANTARASVALPRSEFLENAHIQTVCTRVQFAAHSCPAASIYGHARAFTPLLDEPLEGPVYLRSSSNKLPDMVAALAGPPSRPIEVELDGRIDSVKGGIRSTFELVPDQPVSRFVLDMKGGAKGLIVNSRDLCARTYRATARFDGQNGRPHDFNPALRVSCKAKASHGRRHRRD